jgi:hypothetical protein
MVKHLRVSEDLAALGVVERHRLTDLQSFGPCSADPHRVRDLLKSGLVGERECRQEVSALANLVYQAAGRSMPTVIADTLAGAGAISPVAQAHLARVGIEGDLHL